MDAYKAIPQTNRDLSSTNNRRLATHQDSYQSLSSPLNNILLPEGSINYNTRQHNQSLYFSIPSSSDSSTSEPISVRDESSLEELTTQNRQLNTVKSTYPQAIAAIINGSLYFFVSMAGANEIENLFNIQGQESASNVSYVVSALAALSNTVFVYKAFTGLTLLPTSRLSWFLAILSPLASSSYLTAGAAGARKMGLSQAVSLTIGGTLFVFRNIIMIDGGVKFSERSKSLIADFSHVFSTRDIAGIFIITLASAAAFGISISTTDSDYSALQTISSIFTTSNNSGREIFCYIGSFFGALGIFPAYEYWVNRGAIQLTNRGKPDEQGVNNDPTDAYTYLSVIGSVPSILGVLGSAANSTGKVFGRLGKFSSVVRVSSSIIGTISCTVPGLSMILRNLAGALPSISSAYSWCSETTCKIFCCRKVSETNNIQFETT